ncbi:MAG: TolC family protein [bacterium]
MKLRLVLTLILLHFVPGTAVPADEPPAVGSDMIVKAAVGHSLAIGTADQEVRAARARGRQATAYGLPSLDLEARAMRYEGLEDVQLGMIVIPAIEQRYGAAVSLLQPVYTGNRLAGLRRSAGLQEQAVVAARDGVRADVVLQALSAYWNWAKAYRARDVLEAAVRRMTAHAADIHNMREAGLVTDNDALATDVLVDRTRLALEQVQRQAEYARAQIWRLTGIELATNAVPEPIAADVAGEAPDEKLLRDTALTNRPECAARGRELDAAVETARAARGALQPQVYLAARYEYANPNMLYIPPAEEWKGDAFAGVTVAWNLLDWGLARAKAEEADARAAQAELRRRQQEEQVTLDVKESLIALRDALERVQLSARARKSAELNLESATELWKNGIVRNSDVLDAHARLTDAQNESAVAQADLALARAALTHAAGQTVVPGSKL